MLNSNKPNVTCGDLIEFTRDGYVWYCEYGMGTQKGSAQIAEHMLPGTQMIILVKDKWLKVLVVGSDFVGWVGENFVWFKKVELYHETA